LRKEFDKFKSELTSIIEELRNYNKVEEPINSIKQYFQNTISMNIMLILNIYSRAKESSILLNDPTSFIFLNRAIQRFKEIDYFRNNFCEFPSHISSRTMKAFQSNMFNLSDKNYKILSLEVFPQ
jgi:hypothetical protein